MTNTIQDEFIATVSHELRTPLTSIRGFSQTLLSSWDKLGDEDKKKFIKIIEEQANRLINLVENILSVSKINTDKPIFKKVDVNNSISEVVQLLGQKYKNHFILTDFTADLPPALLDEDKFIQIMTNLVDNACKYSEEGKNVKISTSYYDSEKILIEVKDEGVGIKINDKSKIYDKFIRLENHLTSKTQGNGLGLYITKRLVEEMRGKIDFVSEEGKGTTFELIFPIYNQEEAMACSQLS